MPTTVQVSTETRRLLEKLKKDMGLESYDDVIGRLAKKQARMPDSLFGACRGSRPFKRESEVEHAF